jgi:hypothetical protein
MKLTFIIKLFIVFKYNEMQLKKCTTSVLQRIMSKVDETISTDKSLATVLLRYFMQIARMIHTQQIICPVSYSK